MISLYPVMGMAIVRYYPEACMFITPCLINVFAIAVVVAAIPHVEKRVYVLLLPWAILSLPEYLGAFDCYEFCALIAAGVCGLVLLIKKGRLAW